jgi:hypothetical protein
MSLRAKTSAEARFSPKDDERERGAAEGSPSGNRLFLRPF